MWLNALVTYGLQVRFPPRAFKGFAMSAICCVNVTKHISHLTLGCRFVFRLGRLKALWYLSLSCVNVTKGVSHLTLGLQVCVPIRAFIALKSLPFSCVNVTMCDWLCVCDTVCLYLWTCEQLYIHSVFQNWKVYNVSLDMNYIKINHYFIQLRMGDRTIINFIEFIHSRGYCIKHILGGRKGRGVA